MTQHPGEPDEATRLRREIDAFGRALLLAAREREGRGMHVASRSNRRRGVMVTGMAAVVAVLALLGSAVLPGNDPGTPMLGVTPAAAAASALRATLDDGVLIRDARSVARGRDRSRTQDWTDLATRDQHVRIAGWPADTEFWNPNAHERWTREPSIFRARDGRRVVSRITEYGSANGSASASPVEEIDHLLRDARQGHISLVLGRRPNERVLEQRMRCFGTETLEVLDCGGSGDGTSWPNSPPDGMRAILSYQRWWITGEPRPRMLRYDNGVLDPGANDRKVLFSTRYRVWRIVPRTRASLRLVQVPRFDAATHLILRGRASVVSDAVRDGRVTCASAARDVCPR